MNRDMLLLLKLSLIDKWYYWLINLLTSWNHYGTLSLSMYQMDVDMWSLWKQRPPKTKTQEKLGVNTPKSGPEHEDPWKSRPQKKTPVFFPSYYYSWLPITRTHYVSKLEPRANSNQSWFLLDFLHTFTSILPSVTQTLHNSNLLLTRSNFCLHSDHFYKILAPITWTMF